MATVGSAKGSAAAGGGVGMRQDEGHRRAGGAEAFEHALAGLRRQHRHQDSAPLRSQPGIGGAGVKDGDVAFLHSRLDADVVVADRAAGVRWVSVRRVVMGHLSMEVIYR